MSAKAGSICTILRSQIEGVPLQVAETRPGWSPTNDHVKEQFLLRLEEGPLTQVLRRHVRRHLDETFDALPTGGPTTGRGWMWTQMAGGNLHSCGGVNNLHSHPQKAGWKAELKQEIMMELKDQLKDWTQELLRELKPRNPPRQSGYNQQREPWGEPMIKLKAANGLSIPCLGYATMDFNNEGHNINQHGVFVVEDGFLFNPLIIGMNVV